MFASHHDRLEELGFEQKDRRATKSLSLISPSC
jgi:hypothetical protein